MDSLLNIYKILLMENLIKHINKILKKYLIKKYKINQKKNYYNYIIKQKNNNTIFIIKNIHNNLKKMLYNLL